MAMLAEAFSWRAGFWVLSLAPVLAAAGCYRIITPDPTVPESPFRLHAALSGYRSVLNDRRSRLLQVEALFWAIPWVAGSGFLGALLFQNHGFSVAGVGYGYIWAASWFVAGSQLGIWLMKRTEIYTLIIVSSILLMATTAALFWMPFGVPWILLLMLIWPLNAGVGLPAINSAISEAARTGQGTAMMARQFCWTIGGATGVALGGLLIGVGGYALFGIVGGGCALVVAAAVRAASRSEQIVHRRAVEVTAGR
jgi:predicted MFS family arabinose efflux permease